MSKARMASLKIYKKYTNLIHCVMKKFTRINNFVSVLKG
jgi:hypothetical protein